MTDPGPALVHYSAPAFGVARSHTFCGVQLEPPSGWQTASDDSTNVTCALCLDHMGNDACKRLWLEDHQAAVNWCEDHGGHVDSGSTFFFTCARCGFSEDP